MNKVGRFLFTGFILSAMVIILSLAFAQSSAKKAALANSHKGVRIVLAR